MPHDLHERFIRFVRRRGLVSPGDRVLVAVSGGVDSMVLLQLFREAARELAIEIVAAHFDHGMRTTSAADAEWLAGVCQAWNVALIAGRNTGALYGETAARQARYAFLGSALQQAAATRLATAHHADDQIETVLFRLLRGTGLRGLAGIPLRRGAIIRPLLRFHKSELLDYASARDVPFREDPTNETNVYARNRIRRALIPVMQTINPQSPQAVLALARHAARAERAWRSLLADVRERVVRRSEIGVSELARGVLREYDAEIRARIVRAELRRFGYVPDRKATAHLLSFVEEGASGSALRLGGGVRLERAYDVLRITRTAQSPSERPVVIAGCSDGVAEAQLGGQHWRVQWTTSQQEGKDAARFDCDALRFPLEVRGWRAGDRVRMTYGTKKLKKLFAEARIPFHRRAAVPIVVDADGRVCWIVGVARSVDAPPMQDAPALTITVTHAEIS